MDNKSWATRNRNVYALFFVQYQEICYNRWETDHNEKLCNNVKTQLSN